MTVETNTFEVDERTYFLAVAHARIRSTLFNKA